MEKSCLICIKSFTVIKTRVNTAKYCSESCRGKAQTLRGRIEQPCKVCSKVFYKKKSEPDVYCSQVCMGIGRRKSLNGSGKCLRKVIFNRIKEPKCSDCGYKDYPEILGIHHIDHNHSNNDLSNLIILCANCHSIQHKRHIVHGSKLHKHTLYEFFNSKDNPNAIKT